MWTNKKDTLNMELIQLRQEGYLTEEAEKAAAELKNDEEIDKFYDILFSNLKKDKNYKYTEPEELEDILSSASPSSPEKDIRSLNSCEISDKMKGAWFGRFIGCTLGKPFECGHYVVSAFGNYGCQNVTAWFKGADAYPITNYAPLHSEAEKTGLQLNPATKGCTLGNITCMEQDDDVQYTVLGMKMIEEKGYGFTSWDTGLYWHSHLPYRTVCTAETAAYQNFTQLYPFTCDKKPDNWKDLIKYNHLHRNPYREWIGAAIRIDAFAYAFAGRPLEAAKAAYQDASFSHVKNGVYSAMFLSAMISSAFVEKDVDKLVEIALSFLPPESRAYETVLKAMELAAEDTSDEEMMIKLWQAFSNYDWVHSLNNLAAVVVSVLRSKGDYLKGTALAVNCGFDTDCNGATVGSILGALNGFSNLPEHLCSPLNDTVYTGVLGFERKASISEFAEKSFKTFEKLLNEKR